MKLKEIIKTTIIAIGLSPSVVNATEHVQQKCNQLIFYVDDLKTGKIKEINTVVDENGIGKFSNLYFKIKGDIIELTIPGEENVVIGEFKIIHKDKKCIMKP